ncbi:MAG: GNAT family acetyltransferase, partial [Mycobacteriales bacterium]
EDLHDAAVALWHACALTRPWNDPRTDLLRAVRGPASEVLAVVDGGALVGTVMVGHDGHRGWLYYLAVDPGARRRGLGSHLVRAAEEWLRERGVPKVQLMVRRGNEGVVGFYEALGYADGDVVVLGRFLDP